MYKGEGVILNNIQVYQIDCKVYMMKSIPLSNILEEISHFIDTGLGKNDKMLEFHEKKGYKNYSHSGFKELEKDKVYKEGKVYSFSIRCIDDVLKNYLSKTLPDISTSTIKGLVATVKFIPKMYIERIYTLTPALLKLEEGYWKGHMDFITYEKRIIENSIKKAKLIMGEFEENFVLFNGIKMLNHKPIANSYKNITLLGDKFELLIADNEKAQQVAYILLATGILEGNPRGYGFVNYSSFC